MDFLKAQVVNDGDTVAARIDANLARIKQIPDPGERLRHLEAVEGWTHQLVEDIEEDLADAA